MSQFRRLATGKATRSLLLASLGLAALGSACSGMLAELSPAIPKLEAEPA